MVLLNRPDSIQHCDWVTGWSIAGSRLVQGQDILVFSKVHTGSGGPLNLICNVEQGSCLGRKVVGTLKFTTSVTANIKIKWSRTSTPSM